MPIIARGMKRGNVRNFHDSFVKGYQDIWASEVDEDLNRLYDAWNSAGGSLPTGAAGGDLGGFYPEPTVVKTSGPFTLAQDPAAPMQAATKQYVDARATQWTDTGAALTPATAGRSLVVPGPATATDAAQLSGGTRSAKGRLIFRNDQDTVSLGINRKWNGTAYTQDVTSQPAWEASLDITADSFFVRRQNINNGSNVALLSVDGVTGKTSCTLVDGSVSQAMLAAGAAVKQVFPGTVSLNVNTTTAPLKFATVTGSNLNARTNLVFLNSCLAIGVVAAGQGYAIKVQRNGVDMPGLQWGGNCGGAFAIEFPLPVNLLLIDQAAPTGSVTYDWFMWTSSTGTNIHTPVSTAGFCTIVSLS